MKKFISILMMLMMLLGLCACGDYVSLMPGESVDGISEDAFNPCGIGDLMGWTDFLSNYYDDTPAAVSYQGEAAYLSPVFDRESIIKACDALRNITVTEDLGKADENTQTDECFVFTMSDGSKYELEFSEGKLCYRDELYTIEGADALWELSFPGYSDSFSVFDLYYDSNITTFAENFDSDTPVSVGRRANGGAVISNHDQDMVRRVFSLFSSAIIESVEMSPDQNVDLNTIQDYVFVMEDGSTRTFTFSGDCLTVQASSAYGPVYYHLSNAGAILSLTIAASSGDDVFAGGKLNELRSDIGRAVSVANGEYVETVDTTAVTIVDADQVSRNDGESESDSTESSETTESAESGLLSVAGIYVSFDIDGTQDYISLTGDEATAFVQMLGEMEVLAQQPEEIPENDEITISVNLSDMSGPIIYFSQGAVQRTVGNWYVCGEESYDNMQSRIMEIYYSQLETRMDTETHSTEESTESTEETGG